jgi:hypothetical protein
VYLGEMPPSAGAAKGFLAQFASKKPRTLYRYAQMVKAFMKWYGEPIDDLRIRVPKTIPQYTEDEDVAKLVKKIETKKTHKGTVPRDILLVELDRKLTVKTVRMSRAGGAAWTALPLFFRPPVQHSKWYRLRGSGHPRPAIIAGSLCETVHIEERQFVEQPMTVTVERTPYRAAERPDR